MSEVAAQSLADVLKLCAAAAPAPWYPRTGPWPPFPKEDLDRALERLRLAGLVALTEWTADRGQGYVLTPVGRQALDDPRFLGRAADDRRPATPVLEETPDRPGDEAWRRSEAIKTALLSPSTPTVTYALIALNVAVFLLDESGIRYQGQSLESLLSARPVNLAQGGIWNWLRLLTCTFVHANLIHIFMNMYGLYVLGPLLERLWGGARFLVLYLLSGLGGSCLAIALMPNKAGALGPITTLVGASGAIWGLMTAFAVWVFLNRHYLPRALVSSWGRSLVFVFVINIALSLGVKQISAEAHFGGGAVGGIVAFLLSAQRHSPSRGRGLATLGLVLTPLACLAGLWSFMHRAPAWDHVRALVPRFQAEQRQAEIGHERGQINEVLPDVGLLDARAARLYRDTVAPQLDRNAARRDPQAVAQALEELDDGRKALDEATARLQASGPYHQDEIEKARQTRLELLEARRELFDLARQCLEQGASWNPQDETRLRGQTRKVADLEKRWKRAMDGE